LSLLPSTTLHGGPHHRPGLVECAATYLTVETHGTTTSGMTSMDFDNRFGHEPNALMGTRLDFDGFWNLMRDALRRIG
jgi:inosine-uridine nucleoside N-ribohydrolase